MNIHPDLLEEGWPGELYGSKQTVTNKWGNEVTATVGAPIGFKADVEQTAYDKGAP